MFRKTRSQPCFCHSGKVLALGSVLLSLLSSPAYAAAWTGAVDNDWFNAGNWSGGVPTAGVDGIIDTTTNAPEITSAGAVSRYTYVGNTATGALTVSDGGTLTSSSYSSIGANAGSTGTATVTGAGSLWESQTIFVLGEFGTGTLTISDGGRVTSASYTHLGTNAGSAGTALVTGAGSHLEVTGILRVGYVGSGTLTVSEGGRVTSTTGNIGSSAGSTGTATVTGAGSVWSSGGEMHVGDRSSGVLNIFHGGAVNNTNAYIGDHGAGQGTVMVSDVGSLWTSTQLFLGHGNAGAAQGSLTILNGGNVTATTLVTFGTYAGGVGAAVVAGAGSSFESRGQLRVGASGTGTLTISDGGLVSSTGTMFIALNAGSTGTFNIGAASGDAAAAAGQVTAPTIRFGGGTGTLVLNHTDGCGADGMGCSSLVGGVETAGAAGSDTGLTISSALTGAGSILAQSGVTSFTGNMSAFTGSTTVSDTARLFLDNAYGGNMTVADGGTLSANNTVAGNVTINNDGLLKGNGTIGGDASINAGGRVAPGNSIGTINVGGDVNFAQRSLPAPKGET